MECFAGLPSISDLAVEFGVARTTIQKATESLRDEGVIQTSPMGMFVSGLSQETGRPSPAPGRGTGGAGCPTARPC
jgi:DNA-binding transcriptional regulator YhcF (GntR family)